jgi:hypothetical protein
VKNPSFNALTSPFSISAQNFSANLSASQLSHPHRSRSSYGLFCHPDGLSPIVVSALALMASCTPQLPLQYSHRHYSNIIGSFWVAFDSPSRLLFDCLLLSCTYSSIQSYGTS